MLRSISVPVPEALQICNLPPVWQPALACRPDRNAITTSFEKLLGDAVSVVSNSESEDSFPVRNFDFNLAPFGIQ